MSEVYKATSVDLASQYRNIFPRLLLSFSLLFSLFGSSIALAQHDMHGMSNGGGLLASTMPVDDEVLAKAPQSLMLNFEDDVRLVKLALKETEQGEILIDFRFDPAAGKHFMHSLPQLAAAEYYKVEWAALDSNGELVKGSFYFSFGEGAQPPSTYIEEMDHQMIMSPDYRLL